MNYFQQSFLLACLFLLITPHQIFSQALTQTIRGTVMDKVLQKPIVGATLRIAGINKGDVSDADGLFAINAVPVGVHSLSISAMGFKEQTLNNITLNSGKQIVLSIFLEEKIIEGKEVVVKANRKKNIPLNEMSVVSARSFTVEETQKYAAAVNDPARMASNYAGVMIADDGNNQIVIRGNSPSGLLWRMEGIDIPNPNHFAQAGSSGGGISILSSQLLSNSDFVTGAFASEYGNALSGVFDLKLRKGNNKKREYSAQAGVLGLNVAAEGPIMPLYKGSYLINYRYSTLSILSKTGILDQQAATNFQDLSYNIYLPTKSYGQFSLFSLGGLSNQFYKVKKDSATWKQETDRYSNDFISNTGVWGATHQALAGKNNLIKTALVYSITKNAFQYDYTQPDYSNLKVYDQSFITRKITMSTTLNHRINSKVLIRSGVIANHILFNFDEEYREKKNLPLKKSIDTKQSTQTIQAFSQAQYKLKDAITINTGLHTMLLTLNGSFTVEPRASLRWDVSPKQILSLGYGHHSQLQGWGIYFAEKTESNGGVTTPNKGLGFSKAHHVVLSHQYSLQKNLRLKTEVYYQRLYQIPVSISDTNTYSTINAENDYVRDRLVNKGKGKNYGVEISLEKYLSNNFYYTISTSLYQAKYTAANGKEYDAKFNGHKIFNVIGGKEFISKNQRRTLGLNVKVVYAGGYRTTPINISESITQQTTIYYQERAFTEQLPSYYRGDVRISMKWNRRRLTSTLSLDIQNVSDRKNVYNRYYDLNSNSVKTFYQVGIIPILNYKVEF
jgi:CarboxypepD_reg-like domain